MNKNKHVIAALSIILILSLGVIAESYVLGDNKASKIAGTVTKVSTPEQSRVMTPKWAEASEYEFEDLGENIAVGKTATADSFQDVYEGKYSTDGDINTYWEGKANSYPNNLTVDLGAPTKIVKLRLRVNPDKIWGKRVQTFSILGSNDGNDFKEIVPSTDYQYDPKTGNQVTIDLPQGTEVQFIRAQFTANTGAVGGQVAEFEVYAAN
ncbi:discoidin domain-containing protein [Clostridium thermarum]|uniref:discoidin domain-containing protein n=1 Tax=Clostridium thermarum TaxID=1716543 RepID=UPI0013D3CAA7|nr:discoidin domain-containing protein [Clostridium thermarum]